MGVARMARDHLANPLRAISDGRLEAGTRMKGPHGCMIRDTYSTQRKYEARARVTMVVADLGWIDFDFGSSPGCWAVKFASYCQSRMTEYPRSY